MSDQPPKPTCPNCRYDLSGLIEQGSSATCPECQTHSTFAQATAPKFCTPSIKHAIIWVLSLPSGWMLLFGAQLYIADSLAGALRPYFSGLFLFLYLPTFSLALLIMEWRFRKRHHPRQLYPSFLQTALIIFVCLAVAMTINWVIFMDWVEAVASV